MYWTSRSSNCKCRLKAGSIEGLLVLAPAHVADPSIVVELDPLAPALQAGTSPLLLRKLEPEAIDIGPLRIGDGRLTPYVRRLPVEVLAREGREGVDALDQGRESTTGPRLDPEPRPQRRTLGSGPVRWPCRTPSGPSNG